MRGLNYKTKVKYSLMKRPNTYTSALHWRNISAAVVGFGHISQHVITFIAAISTWREDTIEMIHLAKLEALNISASLLEH